MAQAQRIVDLGNASYLGARDLAAKKGTRLASNVLHDDYLVGSNRYQEVRRVYAAWARELLVHPEKDGKFVKGIDVVDASKDKAGRKWVLPASDVPEQAIGRQKVGLFVDPKDIEVTDKKVVIHPASVVVLDSFIQVSGNGGKVDQVTRIPLEVAPELWEKLSDSERRWLYRINGVGVRPLVRDVSGYYDWRDVDAYCGRDFGYGVAGEATEGGASLKTTSPQLIVLRQSDGELIVRGSKEQVDAAARLIDSLGQK